MKPYEKYKDSGVAWIGAVPEHWEVKKLRFILEIQGRIGFKGYSATDIVGAGQGAITIGAKHISKNNQLDLSEPEFLSWKKYYESPEIMVKKHDLLVVQRGSLGKVAIVADEIGEATINPSILILREINIDSGFLLFFLCSNCFISFIDLINSATAVPMISQEQLNNFKIPIPPLPEQTAIAHYLDQKTGEIDQLIAQKERLLALWEEEKTALINQAVTRGLDAGAKMKESGVAWLGEVPEHWEVKRLKHLSKLISKGTTPSTIGKEIFVIGDVRFLKAENIVGNSVVSDPPNFIDDETNDILKRSQLEENDILFVIAGATLGKVAMMPSDLLPANTNQAVSFIRLKNTMQSKFIWYWLQSDKISKLLWLDAVQSAQPNLSMENLGNFSVPFPPLPEQTAIVRHIETQTARIQTQMDQTRKLIELLKAYRATLISEVVTGKINLTQ